MPLKSLSIIKSDLGPREKLKEGYLQYLLTYLHSVDITKNVAGTTVYHQRHLSSHSRSWVRSWRTDLQVTARWPHMITVVTILCPLCRCSLASSSPTGRRPRMWACSGGSRCRTFSTRQKVMWGKHSQATVLSMSLIHNTFTVISQLISINLTSAGVQSESFIICTLQCEKHGARHEWYPLQRLPCGRSAIREYLPVNICTSFNI